MDAIGGIGTQQRTQQLQATTAPTSTAPAAAPGGAGAAAPTDNVSISSEARGPEPTTQILDPKARVEHASQKFDGAMTEISQGPNGKDDIKGIVGLARQQGQDQARRLAEQNGGKPEDYEGKLDKNLLLAGAGVQYSTQKVGEFSQGLRDQGKSDKEIQQAIGDNPQMQRYLNLGSAGAQYINARHEQFQAEQKKRAGGE